LVIATNGSMSRPKARHRKGPRQDRRCGTGCAPQKVWPSIGGAAPPWNRRSGI
jgi:hypothetical protein